MNEHGATDMCPHAASGAATDDSALRSSPNHLQRDPFRVTRRPLKVAGEVVRRRKRPSPLPPGPLGLPVVGVAPKMMKDPFWYTYECAQRYGDVYRLPMPFYDVVMLNHPDHVARTFNTRGGEFTLLGLPMFTGPARLANTSLAELTEHHAMLRRAINPMMSIRGLTRVADIFSGEYERNLLDWDRWAESGEEFDLQEAIAGLTLPAFLHAMFSTEFTAEQMAKVNIDTRLMLSQGSASFLLRRPSNPVSVARSLYRLTRMMRRLVEKREASPNDAPDLLASMLGMSDDMTPLMRDIFLAVVLTGGYETVVAATSWTFSLIRDNPQAQQRLYDEIDTLGGARPTMADLKRLPWTKACFDEAQRMQAHPFQPHAALVDTEIDGYPIPKGTTVAVSPHSLQNDPRWWQDPHRYDPTRFVDADVVAARPKLSFIPFGHGQHHCAGSAMAYMSGQFLLTQILQRYRVHVRPGWKPVHDTTWSTTVKGGVPVTITKR